MLVWHMVHHHLLLLLAQDRVHTAWSSYGYTAAGMAGQPVNMVVAKPRGPPEAPPGQEQLYMGVPHKSDKREQCVRLPTHQPCFHKFMSWVCPAHCCQRVCVWGGGGGGGHGIGPHAHGNAARHVVGDLNAQGSGQQKP